MIGARVPRGAVPRAALLGHRRPLPLRPPATDRPHARPADRRRRGPQDRPGGRHGRPLSPPRDVDARAVSRRREEVEFRWSGQVMEPVDGLAFIGRNPLRRARTSSSPPATRGMGMTHGTIAGMLLTDLILGRENPWATLYDPSRKTVRRRGGVREGEPERRGAVHRLASRRGEVEIGARASARARARSCGGA